MSKAFTQFKWRWLEGVQDDPTCRAALALGLALVRDLNGASWRAFPGQQRLGERAGLKERQVRNQTRLLVDAGRLKIRSGGYQKPHRYELTFPDRQQIAGLNPAENCRSETPPDRQRIAADTGNELPPNPLREPFEKEEPPVVPRLEDGQAEQFERFWKVCPKKVGKKLARQAFSRALKSGATFDLLIDGMAAYAASVRGREPQYVKHPTSWLNGEHWLDEITPPKRAVEKRVGWV